MKTKIKTNPPLARQNAKKGKGLLAVLTPKEDASWEYFFNFYKDDGYSDSDADEAAWRDMKQEFPRLRKYKGCC